MHFFSCISEHRTVNNMWKKEREMVWWRTNSGEIKVTDAEGERERETKANWNSHIRWGGGWWRQVYFKDGWRFHGDRAREQCLTLWLVQTRQEDPPPHWKPEPADAEDQPLEVNASSTVESWWCEVKALLPWWRQSNAVVQ